jgi:4-hydroxybutyrate CoA-transferase
MRWTERFADRVGTLEQAAAFVRSGDRVLCGLPEPAAFLRALGEHRGVADVDLFVPAPRAGAIAAAANPGVRLHAPFVTQAARKAKTPIEVLPVHFSGWPGMIDRWAARVSVVLVAEPRPDGTVYPGGTVAADPRIVRRPRRSGDVVIGLVSPGQPEVPGETFRVEDFDLLVAVPDDEPPVYYDERTPPKDLEAFVGAVSELVPDGATLQAGVGGIAEAVMERLSDKVDLGVHTEVLGGGMRRLIESGAVTNARKGHHDGVTVATICLPETWDYVTGNPKVRLLAAEHVLDPREVARNARMRCVNSALQVDLYGQGNAEMIDGVQYSGVGGQLDFHRACSLAPDALSILVLASTTAGGSISRIVPHLGGNTVTATRYDTQVVVTEHGVAWLRDATMRQKAERLIAIAHPDHRAWLTEEAERVGLL